MYGNQAIKKTFFLYSTISIENSIIFNEIKDGVCIFYTTVCIDYLHKRHLLKRPKLQMFKTFLVWVEFATTLSELIEGAH